MRKTDAISLPQNHPLPRLTAHFFFSFFSEPFGSPSHFHSCHCPIKEINRKNESNKTQEKSPNCIGNIRYLHF